MSNIIAAEWRKQRLLPFIIPLVCGPLLLIAIMYVAIRYQMNNGLNSIQTIQTISNLLQELWSYIVIIVVMIFSSAVAEVEHRSKTWTLLFIAPQPKWKHLAVKVGLAAVLCQLFGLLSWLAISVAGMWNEGSLVQSLALLGRYSYGPFLFALPYILFQTTLAQIIRNTFVVNTIGMAVFLLHQSLPYWWLPWGAVLQYVTLLPGSSLTVPIAALLVNLILYGLFSFMLFYRESFILRGE